MTGVESIAAERKRQVEAEGWTPEHDDEHRNGEIAEAAAGYLVFGNRGNWAYDGVPPSWPWHPSCWKPKDRRADLVRAGALIAAEIDRLDRMAERACDHGRV